MNTASRWVKKRRVMRRYDLTATMYDMRYAEEQAAKIGAALENLSTKKNWVLLDVGCGTGVLFDYVAGKIDAIVGLDFSKRTLLVAKKKVRNACLSNVDLIQADADDMPFKSGLFNSVFAMTVVQNTPDPETTLKEMTRVAHEDAVFVITGLKKIFTKRGFIALLQNAELKPLALEEDGLKCYVAVCANHKEQGTDVAARRQMGSRPSDRSACSSNTGRNLWENGHHVT